jgi:hypothetical protein
MVLERWQYDREDILTSVKFSSEKLRNGCGIIPYF